MTIFINEAMKWSRGRKVWYCYWCWSCSRAATDTDIVKSLLNFWLPFFVPKIGKLCCSARVPFVILCTNKKAKSISFLHEQLLSKDKNFITRWAGQSPT